MALRFAPALTCPAVSSCVQPAHRRFFSMLSQKQDVYAQITAALIDAIEQGAGRYEMPWHSLSAPVNALNHKPYRGINIVMLWAAAQKRAYSSNEWATYRQWEEIGAQVRKGERSTIVVFWK